MRGFKNFKGSDASGPSMYSYSMLGGYARGVPPGKFWNLGSLKCDFQHYPSNILKIVKPEFHLAKHPFSAPGKHLFSDLSELYVYMLCIE